jgi:fructose-1,6-bisphosphatase
VRGFGLDPATGRFRLTHPAIAMPPRGRTYAVNDANRPRWGPGARALVDALRARGEGPAAYALRYGGALVGDVHRILLEGGLYAYPGEPGGARATGRVRLLYEAAPLGYVVEQAGGRASTGRRPVLDVPAVHYHQTVPLFIGSREEVERAETLVGSEPDPA